MPTTTTTWTVESRCTHSDTKDGLLPPFDALFALQNDSDAVLEILDISISDKIADVNNFGAFGNRSASRLVLNTISAHSGGTDMTIEQFNAGNTAMPAQVVFKRYPDTVTTVNTIRRFSTEGQLLDVNASTAAPQGGGQYGSMHPYGGAAGQTVICYERSAGDIVPIVLAAGEGIAVKCNEYIAQPVNYLLNFVFINSADNTTYCVNEVFCSQGPDVPIFSFLNGTGSGVTLKVISFSLEILGYRPATQQPDAFRIHYINHALSNSEITPYAHDSSSVMPTGIKVYRSPVVSFNPREESPYGTSYEASIGSYVATTTLYRDLVSRNLLRNIYLPYSIKPGNTLPIYKNTSQPLYSNKKNTIGAFKCNPGEGIAIMWGSVDNQSVSATYCSAPYSRNNYNISITFNVIETTAAPSTGATHYAFM